MRAESMKGISMEIGDYGWIECKGNNEKYTGWFLRAKVEGKVTYINKVNTSFMFPDTKITSPGDDYVLHYKVSAIDALNGRFPELTKEDMERRNLIAPINNKIKEIESDIENKKKYLSIKNKELDDLKVKLYNLEHNIFPIYKLVYGVHALTTGSFEYTWLNDKDLDINVGDIVEVNTSCGVERIYVTKLEDSKVESNHKTVIRKADRLS